MVAIRRAEARDARAVGEIQVASWRDTYRDELPGWYLDGMTLPEATARWEGLIGSDRLDVWVAEDGDRVVGFAAFGPTPDPDDDPAGTVQLFNLHVRPDLRGGGVGTALWDRLLARLRDGGLVSLTLWVVEGNARARRFYDRKGMQADGARRVEHLAPGAGLREIRYRISITASG